MKRLTQDLMQSAQANARPEWGIHALVVSLLLAWIGYWYSGTIGSMVAIWSRSATFTHGFFILPISFWLVWRKREELLKVKPIAAPYFLIVVAFAGCLWLLGAFFEVNAIAQLAFVCIVVATIVVVLGFEVARLLFFPLAFLFFAVPTGEFLLPFLMKATADFTVIALRLSGIPVHREGLQFIIPTGNWSVVEACSGIRYLIASVTVGSLFAYLNYRSWRRRFFFVGVSILVPLVANWLRAYIIVLIGHLSNNRLATGVDHIIYGWVFFGIVLVLMFMIGIRWSENVPALSAEGSQGSATVASASSFSSFAYFWPLVGITAMLVIVPALMMRVSDDSSLSTIFSSENFNLREELGDGWRRAAVSSFDSVVLAEKKNIIVNTAYQSSDDIVFISIVVEQRPSTDLFLNQSFALNAENNDVNTQKMRLQQLSCGSQHIEVNAINVVRHLGAAGDNELISARQIFYVDDNLTANPYMARIFKGLARLGGRDGNVFSIIFYTMKSNADERLTKFMRLNCSLVFNHLHESSSMPTLPSFSKFVP